MQRHLALVSALPNRFFLGIRIVSMLIAVGLMVPHPTEIMASQQDNADGNASRRNSGADDPRAAASQQFVADNLPGDDRGDDQEAHEDDDQQGDRGNAVGLAKKRLRGGSSSGVARGDFNGDGFADLAVGVPDEETPAGVKGSGAVIVIYGSVSGLTTTDPSVPASQFWSQNSTGVPGASEAGDHFGSALASGDFNADGFSDLAIGIPGEDITVNNIVGTRTDVDAGGVVIIYGSCVGLTASGQCNVGPLTRGAQFLDLPEERIDLQIDGRAAGAKLGSALAWGDFDGDGYGDLAIGAEGFSHINSGGFVQQNAGAVWMLTGTADGINTAIQQFWKQEDTGLQISNVADRFGHALTAGDFNHDGVTDLAIGTPGENVGFATAAGSVVVLRGAKPSFLSHGGLTASGAQRLIQGRFGLQGSSDAGDNFGTALGAGDFNGDGAADLAVGVPRDHVNGRAGAGHVNVIFGSASGLVATGNQLFTQDNIFGLGASETGDAFATSLAAGDFNGDGRADLAIGVPGEDVSSLDINLRDTNFRDTGEVDILYGSNSGLTTISHVPQRFQLAPLETGAQLGFSLSAWNYGKNESFAVDGRLTTIRTADLAMGTPFKDVGTALDAGAVAVVYGSSALNGLSTTGAQLWTQDSPGVVGSSEAGDHFGAAAY